MIKVIAFDLGGVLFTDGKTLAAERLEKEKSYPKDKVLELLNSPESKQLTRGLISEEKFWQWAEKKYPDFDLKLLKSVWYESYFLDEGIYSLIKKLKPRFKIVAFSVNIPSRVEFIETRYSFQSLFDEEIYSFDYHLHKEDEKFYDILPEVTKVKPEEILLVDDNEKHVVRIKKAGLNLILYKSGKTIELINEMKKLGVHT